MICSRFSLFILFAVAHAVLAPRGIGSGPVGDIDESPAPVAVKLDSIQHLPNAHRLPGDVFSGGVPADEQAFRELADLGVKTVVSVDGAPPNVAMAQRFGLRYVHLPFGYGGIPAARTTELAKAVYGLPRPLYFHCHHGQHRSPAAAVVACIANGLVEPEAADEALKQMGTAPHYAGLYQSANEATRIDPQWLADLQIDFASTVDPPPLIHAMLEIEHLHNRLARLIENGWDVEQSDASTLAAHLALLLNEQFVEMQRLTESNESDLEFADMLQSSVRNSSALASSLRQSHIKQHAESTELSAQRASQPGRAVRASWKQVNNDCRTCHRRFRDTPR